MSTLELKNNILSLLVHIDNNEKLSDIYEYLKGFTTDEVSSKLTDEQESILDEAIAQTYDASTLIAHEEAIKMMKEW